jgi:diguanylate cyclase (GGDEF)-like protein/PAS domain S-box-containing protein
MRQDVTEPSNRANSDLIRFELSKKFLQAVYDTSPDMILVFNKDDQLIDANQNAINQLQYSKAELSELCRDQLFCLNDSLTECIPAYEEWHAIRKDGSELQVEINIAKLPEGIFINGLEANTVLTARDITDRKLYEDKRFKLAYYDRLTGLVNRTLLEDRGQQAVLRAKRYDQMLAFLYIDLDNFKQTNDVHGHHIGDRLLRAATARIQTVLLENDTFGRLGGDKFLIIVEEVHGLRDAQEVAGKILNAASQTFGIDRQRINISASIGISLFPEHSSDYITLLRQADSAMYNAKQLGRNRMMHFVTKKE